jgi:hypothetical protein
MQDGFDLCACDCIQVSIKQESWQWWLVDSLVRVVAVPDVLPSSLTAEHEGRPREG